MRKRKWENYASGEELFGLPVTLYPELEQTEKEIQMLDRLYNLYVTVISTIKGYGDYFWVDVVEKISEMGETVNQYQAQSKKLPKALRDWQAYVDCRRTIDDFLEMLPLFEVGWGGEGRKMWFRSVWRWMEADVCRSIHGCLGESGLDRSSCCLLGTFDSDPPLSCLVPRTQALTHCPPLLHSGPDALPPSPPLRP